MKTFLQDVIRGLSSSPKAIPSRYFYDDAGNKLFQEIMQLEEYYLPEAEMEIIENQTSSIIHDLNLKDDTLDLIELGAGDGSKTLSFIEQLSSTNIQVRYYPLDISPEVLEINRGLMQLFVVHAGLNNLELLLRKALLEQFFQMLIHMLSVASHFRNGWPAHEPALGTQYPVAERVVVTIEQEGEVGVEFLVVLEIRPQDQLLEKPRRVRDVPFRRRNVDDRLRNVIFGFERRAKFFRGGANFLKKRQ